MMFDPSPRMGRSCCTKLRCPTRATKSIFHVGMQVIMRKTNYYVISRAKCFNY